MTFAREYWANKNELGKDINMKCVHHYAKTKNTQMVYLEIQRVAQKSRVNRAAQNWFLKSNILFKTAPTDFKPLATD
jgi:hypothetical protein